MQPNPIARNRNAAKKERPMKPALFAIAVALMLFTALPAGAATQTWLGNSGTWDGTTTANWSGNAVPINGDTTNLTQVSVANLGIGYTAANLSGTGLASLTLGNTGGGTTTLTLDGTDSLPTQKVFVGAGGAVNQTGGTLANSSDDSNFNFIQAGGAYTMSGGTWSQTGGYIGSRGTVNQSGGAVSASSGIMLVDGTWTISGGSLTASGGGSDFTLSCPWGVSPAPPTGATPTLNISGTGTVNVGRIYAVGGGLNNPISTVNQSGGTVNIGAYLLLKTGGTYNLSGGSLNGYIQGMAAGTVFNQTGGDHNATNGANIGATYNFTGGNWILGNALTLGAGGTVNWTGGTLKASDSPAIGSLQLTGSGASWTMKGTTLSVNRFGGGGANSLIVAAGATLQGYGTVQDSRFGASSPGTFQASGRVIANGYGVDRTLDVSRWNNAFTNPTDNATNNGWFAVNQGKLMLPTLTVTPVSGAATVFWGESATDADGIPDLVNSVKLAFTGLTAGGTVTGSLLAADRADANRSMPVNDPLDTGMYALIGAWNVTAAGINFGTGSATLTFRYDDAWATQAATDMARLETDLKLLKFNGSSWDILTAGVTMDAAANWVAVSGVNSFSLYGIAMLPEPGACTLGALAVALLAARRRRLPAVDDRGHRGR